jgi:uncharacterized protein YndB with AHSA1/START domain
MTSEPRAATADGTVDRTDDGRYVVRFERRLAHPVERVWRALTAPEELIKWWGDADLDLEEGGHFNLRWLNTDEEGNAAELHARIAKLVPERLLLLDGDIHGLLRWELTPDGDGTLLSFRSTLSLPEEFLTKVPAGWHFHLDALADHLEGRSTDLVNLAERWEPIHAAYQAKLP